MDRRAQGSLTIAVDVRPQPSAMPAKLAPPSTGSPAVYLQTDDQGEFPVAAEDVLTQPDQLGVTVSVKAGQLGIGRLKVRVVLSDTTTLQATFSSSCAVTQSPVFAAGTAVPLSIGPRSMPINGFTGVQIGTVLGKAGRLLLAEQFAGAMGFDQRWAELDVAAGAGVAPDTSNSTWTMVQKLLQESNVAQFAVTRDALLIYDVYKGGPAEDLSLFWLNQPSPTRVANLTSVEPKIQTDRTTLAATSDDQLMLLGSQGKVAWFRVAPTGMPVTFLNDAVVTGSPVLAARAERVATPKIAYGAYFGVAWGTDGTATLLRANAQTMNLSAEPLDATAQQGFTTSLQGQQVVAAALADLNGDGLEDLLVATSDKRLLWAAQQLDNHFAAVNELNIVPAGAVTGMSVGDINGDGLADLALIASSKLFIYFGAGM